MFFNQIIAEAIGWKLGLDPNGYYIYRIAPGANGEMMFNIFGYRPTIYEAWEMLPNYVDLFIVWLSKAEL